MSIPSFGNLRLLKGTANPALALRIADATDIPLTEMEVKRFADGELDVKIADSVRGQDVFVIQPTCPPVNENYMELFVILDALRRASAARITPVISYFGYARKEKKTQARDPITAKLMANFIQTAGANRVITVDLHAEAIQGFFDIPVDALTAVKILGQHVLERHGHDVVIVSPDVGGTARARALASNLGEAASIAIIDKRRPRDDTVEMHRVIGDVDGRRCVIIDDLISTGATLVAAANALRREGATGIDVVATHPVFSNGALQRLHAAPIDAIAITDTIPLGDAQRNGHALDRLHILSVAPLIAEAIVRVHEGRSVSELFR